MQPHLHAQVPGSQRPFGDRGKPGNGNRDLKPGLVIVKELEILGAYTTTQAELNEFLRLVETGPPHLGLGRPPLTDAAHTHDRREKETSPAGWCSRRCTEGEICRSARADAGSGGEAAPI